MADRKLEIILAAKDQASKVINDANNKITSSMTRLENRVLSFSTAWVKAAGAIYGASKAWDAVKLGARAEQEAVAFANMAASFGANADQIVSALKRASGEAVDTMTLMQKAGTAMMMGIAPNEVIKLMEIARATSRMTGQTVTKAFEDISLAVGRQSRKILDNLGIIVKQGDANETYARQLGKLSTELTDVERRQAFMNATVAAGDELIAKLGDTTETTAEMFASWEIMVADLKVALSKGLMGALKWTVMGFTQAGAIINQTFEMIAEGWGFIMEALGKIPGGEFLGFAALGQTLRKVAEHFRQAREEANRFTADILNVGKGGKASYTMPAVTVTGEAEGAIKKHQETQAQFLTRMKSVLFGFHDAAIAKYQARRDLELEIMAQGATDQATCLKTKMQQLTGHHDAALIIMQAQMEAEAEMMLDAQEANKSMFDEMSNAMTGWASSFSSDLNDMLWGAETTFADIARSFAKMLTQMAIQKAIVEPIVGAGLSFLGGMFHQGGIVGQTPVPAFAAPASLWTNAPRLHKGLAGDEYPAILQRGETVLPRGGGLTRNVRIEIENKGSEKQASDARVRFDVDGMVVGIVLTDIQQNGPIRQALGPGTL